MDLQLLANLAEIFGVVLVVAGVVFGLLEVRNYREQRQEVAAMEIMRTFQSPEFTRALRLIMDLENGAKRNFPYSIRPRPIGAATTVMVRISPRSQVRAA